VAAPIRNWPPETDAGSAKRAGRFAERIHLPMAIIDKGSRKNNFAELALRFGPGLADPRVQNYRNSELFRGFWE